jgi:RimJ/RimL family protein N-acetyltransferase
MQRPPEVIRLPDVGVVLRRHRIEDLDALHAAIEESRDHLRPFMFWADQSRADTAAFLDGATRGWDAGQDFGYLIVDEADGSTLGGGGLHRRGPPETLEIGYWRRARAGGRGIVTALASALTAAGLALPGIERIEIHCDVANAASGAVPRRLGYAMAGIIDVPVRAPAETGRHAVWVWPADRSAAQSVGSDDQAGSVAS